MNRRAVKGFLVADRLSGNLREQERRQRQRHGECEEQPDVGGYLRAGEARHQQQAGADAAKQHEGAQEQLLPDSDMGIQAKARCQIVQAMVPSDSTSNPRAISSCDRTGSVANMRSRIILT